MAMVLPASLMKSALLSASSSLLGPTPNGTINSPLEPQDWSFAHLPRSETLWGPHGYHRYPAKFIPQLVRSLIECYSSPKWLVCDPFVGSGTTGIEAIRVGRRFYGSDINPVAIHISEAKCTPLDPQILDSKWQAIEQHLSTVPQIGRRQLDEEELRRIEAIDIARASSEERFEYWFPLQHRLSLDCLLQSILNVSEDAYRTFFLCAFSNILRRCSIWLSGSTKPQKDLAKRLSDPAEEFRKQVRGMIKGNRSYWNDLVQCGYDPHSLDYHLVVEDARHLSVVEASIDFVVTSPPYATCYEYIDLHQLTQLWFERYNLLTPSNLRSMCIGSKVTSARSKHPDEPQLDTGSNIADAALRKLAALATDSMKQDIRREVRPLIHYFQDMSAAMHELARAVADRKHMVLIIGDSTKRGVMIPTSAALCEIANKVGFTLERKIVRKVPARVLTSTREKKTGRFSSKAQSDTRAYPEEDILVFTRRPRSERQ